MLIGTDDFGQILRHPIRRDTRHTWLEYLDQIEQARIQRALADERVKAKFMQCGENGPGDPAGDPGTAGADHDAVWKRLVMLLVPAQHLLDRLVLALGR